MKVGIHLTFMEAVGRLQASERRQVEGMIRRLSEAGPTPGMRPHKLSGDCAGILSLSVNMDLRVLALPEQNALILIHVDHHDAAYKWAERNSLGLEGAAAVGIAHQSGAIAQAHEGNKNDVPAGFGTNTRTVLEAIGCPAPLVRLLASASDESELLEHLELLAPEWQELVMEALGGATPEPPAGTPSNIWVAPADETLKRALSLPAAHWRIFLHPSQRKVVEAGMDGDLVVAGGPGTGKTVVLVHRACHLAEQIENPSRECVVLVGHSPGATTMMTEMVRALRGEVPDSLHITDMVAIGRRGKPRASDVRSPGKGSRPWHLGKEVLALVIDESQDMHRTTKPYILGRRPQVTTHVTLAMDPNQNIFADNTEDDSLVGVLRRADTHFLTYSYRIPREAGVVALELLSRVGGRAEPDVVAALRQGCRRMSFGFASDFVRLQPYDEILDGISEAAAEVERLRAAGHRNVAVVFCGSRKDRSRHADALMALGYDPGSDRGLLTPRFVKGNEYDYCCVVAPELLTKTGHGREDFAYHAIYVALSRCRRGVALFGQRDFLSGLRVAGTDPR